MGALGRAAAERRAGQQRQQVGGELADRAGAVVEGGFQERLVGR